ncbi:uncharacterized protein N7484_006744 [Penicillium longicatenatum]|uniref:uncharacterized protein n=1 Tax=Penicillium longicatenatum TaxID=1561947 RepID=UPI002549B14F|nr:uncharacterized protein N7484_006744 [Penicillium longicatenatum]KAJ5644237.1 hypothetical protein N7484_006744 [Penicillium longicatenatum]
MSTSVSFDHELALALERHSKYIGTAKVSLDQLRFVPALPDGIDSRKSERLQEIFKIGQCARLDVQNHIPAIISHDAIEGSLAFSGITRADLLNASSDRPPLLNFPNGQLKALHGRHRIEAASKALFPDDRWWTVDLYLDGITSIRILIHALIFADIGEALRATLLDEYANESLPTDGQIYRKIRQYEGEGNVYFRERWYLRLSKTGRERLDQLDNPRNRALRAGFDKLLAIPGVWGRGMRISLLARIIASDCIDVS